MTQTETRQSSREIFERLRKRAPANEDFYLEGNEMVYEFSEEISSVGTVILKYRLGHFVMKPVVNFDIRNPNQVIKAKELYDQLRAMNLDVEIANIGGEHDAREIRSLSGILDDVAYIIKKKGDRK